MWGIGNYGAFVAAIIVFLMIPGPGNLALVTSTGKGGVRGGLAAALGLVVGHQCLMWLAMAGLAGLLASSAVAFAAVQWLGACYLAWLGLRMLLARRDAAPLLRIEPRHYLRQALTITLLNPKAIVFYMAFFPQFLDPARPHGLRTFVLMAVTLALLTAVYDLLVVVLTHFLAARLRASPVLGRTLRQVAGVFLIGFGVRLALSR